VKPTIPEVIDRFRAYHDANITWGSLHIVLDDGNVRDDDVTFCIEWAREHDDAEGESLGRILLQMSKTQRKKLGDIA
jgi:hypothetical protein